MKKPPKKLIDEIGALGKMETPELLSKYGALLADMPDCRICGVLRSVVAYRLQENFYGIRLSDEAAAWLDNADEGSRLFPNGRPIGTNARLVRFYKGVKHEVVVREDGRFEYNGEIHNSLSAIAQAITGTHWNGKLFFGVK